ncbi:2-hydroxymuconate tautomerase [Periweissella fabalis]|uniref:Tautomerase n=1 Tax=Periweissella fabalis TaxID=1070421 RepID=A0A7X6S2R7_9LACO|nr:2-hydroxymuconate tautomerase [Periweissella fabalis]MCM0598987.1 4-oxalocrotonate tautomerase [Periweissella fabalis]NKZ23267.1 4-oxalocrotonate tautomerase [Periweissella fabalis]
MPIVHIELIEGRSQEAIKKMVQDVTNAVAQNTGAPAAHVHVVVNEMAKERYAVGGVLKSDEN